MAKVDSENYGQTLDESSCLEMLKEGLMIAVEGMLELAELTQDPGWIVRGRDLATGVDYVNKLFTTAYSARADK